MTDYELLRNYHLEGAESSFRELMRRHIDVVHSAAMRQVFGDAHLAKDVTQRVFLCLARKAHILPADTVIVAWLYQAIRFEGARVVKSEVRRRNREEKASIMNSSELTSHLDYPGSHQTKPTTGEIGSARQVHAARC